MRNLKLACFDLDDTLIREIHSVMLPCILNGKEREHSLIQEQEDQGVLNYIQCLQDFCKNNSIKPHECIAVGDGSTDIPIFEYCEKSIAINSSPKVQKSAMYAVDTDDLTDILKYILCA